MTYREPYQCPHERQELRDCEIGCCYAMVCLDCGTSYYLPSPEPAASFFQRCGAATLTLFLLLVVLGLPLLAVLGAWRRA